MAKGRWYGVDVNFFHKKTCGRLLEELGPYGPLVFLSLIAEAKRSSRPGTIEVTSEPHFWAMLGFLESDAGFGMNQFLDLTGRLKQTRKVRVGHLLDVVLTHYGDWQKDIQRENEREKKSRYRAQMAGDKAGTPKGTRSGQEGGQTETAASTKNQVLKPVDKPEKSELAAAEELEAPRPSAISKVCDQFGADLRQVEPLAQALTGQEFATVAATVAERCRTGHVGNPAGLLVQLLRDRLKRKTHEHPVAVLSLEDEVRLDATRLTGHPLEVVVDLLEHKLRKRKVAEADWPRLTQLAMEAFAEGGASQ